MILEAGEICPFAAQCPYNNNSVMNQPCQGALKSRDVKFTCEFVVNGQIIKDAGTRIPGDKTGKMKVILE